MVMVLLLGWIGEGHVAMAELVWFCDGEGYLGEQRRWIWYWLLR
jgi:hypothetical protein